MSVIVKNLEKNSITFEKKVVVSHFIPKDLKENITRLPENSYILGVGYQKGHQNYFIPENEKYGEFQIGISGHPHEDEEGIEGFDRELEEELSLKILDYSNITKNNNTFCINIKDCTICGIKNEEKDGIDKKERFIMLVYGDKNDALNYLEKIEVNGLNNDKIKYLWCCEKETAIKTIDYMTNGGKFYPKKNKVYYTSY